MSDKIRRYDSNTLRKTNKQYHQLEKNILEKNYFNYIGIIEDLNQGPTPFESKWCKVRLIPTIRYKEFNRSNGYSSLNTSENDITKAFIPESMTLSKGDIVLISFTDSNFKNVLIDILKGYDKTRAMFETDITKHSINFGIVTNILVRAT